MGYGQFAARRPSLDRELPSCLRKVPVLGDRKAGGLTFAVGYLVPESTLGFANLRPITGLKSGRLAESPFLMGFRPACKNTQADL